MKEKLLEISKLVAKLETACLNEGNIATVREARSNLLDAIFELVETKKDVDTEIGKD